MRGVRLRLLLVAALGAGTLAAGAAGAGELPGVQTGPAPWPAERLLLGPRLAILGLPALGAEGQALHIHQHLDVYVHRRHVTVPAGIGFDAQLRFLSPIHTHDATGVIHVESPTLREFTLGQVFGVWGVRFTKQCLGGYCVHGRDALRVFVNGKARTGDPRKIELASHQEIVVAYGTKRELPAPLPHRYTFPNGL